MKSIARSLFDERIGVTVVLRENETIESMIKRFKKKVQRSEILKEAKSRMEYLKPSERKRKKSADARRRDEHELLKMERLYEKKQKKAVKEKRLKKQEQIDKVQSTETKENN